MHNESHDEHNDDPCGHEHGEMQADDEQPRALLLGYGDIASRLAPLLQELGFAVTGVRRNPERAIAVAGVDVRAGDVQQTQTVAELLTESWDLIVFTLTPSSYSGEGYRQGYVVPVQHLVQQLSAQVSDTYQPLILYVGSTSVYGQRDGNWVDENSLTEPDSETGKMLLEAENVLRESALNTIIVRAAGIYGPGRERMYQALKDGTYTITPTWHNRIHADDVAGALEHLALQSFMGAELDEVYIACENPPLFGENYVLQLAHELDLDADALLAQLPTTNEIGPRGNKRLSSARLRATGWEAGNI